MCRYGRRRGVGREEGQRESVLLPAAGGVPSDIPGAYWPQEGPTGVL